MTASIKETLVELGKAQVDAMFARQDEHTIDNSEFIPLLETVLRAFESHGSEPAVAEELWDYAYQVFHQLCREAVPEMIFEDSRVLMRSYLLGPRSLFKSKGRR